MLKRITIGLALLFILVALPAKATERITSFNSYVTINPDGSADVTDFISVNAEHKSVRLGLVLDFYKYRNDEASEKRIKTDYDFKSVKRNGQDENFWTERRGSGKIELLLGAYEDKPSNYIPTGINTYEIKYHVTNMVSFFTEEDGFYYNVTGNDWDLPIDKVSAEITLPEGAAVNSYSGYTGSKGSQSNDYIAEVKDNKKVYFETTRPFKVKEGFTLSVSFAKGFVDRENETLLSAEEDNNWEEAPFGLAEWKKDGLGFSWRFSNPLLWSLMIAVAVFLYYFIVWLLYGRDLQKETVVPTYIPPRYISDCRRQIIGDFCGIGKRNNIYFNFPDKQKICHPECRR